MGTIDLSHLDPDDLGDDAATAQEILKDSDALRRLLHEASRPAREASEQLAKVNIQGLREAMLPAEELSRQLTQFHRSFAASLSEIIKQSGLERDHLSKLAESARSQARMSAEIFESARRLTAPPSVIRAVEIYQHDAQESLQRVEEIQKLEAGAHDDETPDDIAVRALQQSVVQTELVQRQGEVFESMLKVLEEQLADSRQGERAANVKWWIATAITIASLLVALFALLP